MSRYLPVLKRPLRAIRRLIHDRRGAAAIMLAIALSGIVGFAGLGSEVAAWYFTTRAMQGAASSAAASAAASLAAAEVTSGTTQCPTSPNFCQDTGRAVAATFNFTNGVSSTTVAVNNPPNFNDPQTHDGLPVCTAPFSASYNCYVEVVISQPQAALLSAVVMPSGWSPTITTRAVARANTTAASTGCVVALDKHASRAMNSSGSGTLTFNNCALYANSDASDGIYVGGSGTVNAQAAYVVGNINGTVNTAAGYGTYTGVNPIVDPYANVTMPSSSTTCTNWSNYANGNSSMHLTSAQVGILKPASAGGTCAIPHDVTLDASATLVLCPGVYVFNNSSNLTMAGSSILLAPPSATSNPAISAACIGDLTGGVTIVFANSTGNPGAPTIGGGATVNLTAPTSGATAGIAIFQQRTTCTGNGNGNGGCPASLQGGGTQNITGAIYIPNNAISYAGGSSTGSQCTQIVANTITFTGGSTFNSDCQSLGGQTINNTNGTLVM